MRIIRDRYDAQKSGSGSESGSGSGLGSGSGRTLAGVGYAGTDHGAPYPHHPHDLLACPFEIISHPSLAHHTSDIAYCIESVIAYYIESVIAYYIESVWRIFFPTGSAQTLTRTFPIFYVKKLILYMIKEPVLEWGGIFSLFISKKESILF